jgi:putative RNA 2'-phosphotransferase
MSKKTRIKSERLGPMLAYVLGRNPSEFGLVPDNHGFVTYKELLQALHEEPGWGYVREGGINEVLVGEDRSLFEADAGRIRALDRQWTFDMEGRNELPAKILFLGIRRKAHPVVMDRGLSEMEGARYILSPDRAMSERIAKRRDPEPVILEIMADAAREHGIPFYRFGDLFLTREVPVRFIAGPPVPKNVIRAHEEQSAKNQAAKRHEMAAQFQAGTFALDMENAPPQYRRDKGGKKKRTWKEDARKERKRMRIEPW